jgi:hypothetical protein
VEIRPTHADALHADDRDAIVGGRRRGIPQGEPARLLHHYLPHQRTLPGREPKDIPDDLEYFEPADPCML